MEAILVMMLVSIIRLSVPIIIAGLGNMYCEKTGVMNLGAEGMMIAGAFGGVIGAYFSGSAWLGVLAGVLMGTVVGLLHSLICVEFGGIQNISGLGLNMLAAGITSFFCRTLFGNSLSPSVASLQASPALAKVPVIGHILMQFSPIAYLCILVIFLSWFLMKKMILGKHMTAAGDDPQTAITAGIQVWKIRHFGVITCGALVGLAGAYLSIGQLNIFMENMTNGKGMLAVIAVKMGRWEPKRIVAIALLFGLFDAVQIQLQFNNVLNLSPELIQTIPFILGLTALALDSASAANPTALTKPYLKSKYKY